MKMNVFSRTAGVFAGLLASMFCLAQDGHPVMEFGNVGPDAFAATVFDKDSATSAIILFDHGVVNYDPDYGTRGYAVTFERHTRIRLLNRSAFRLASFNLATYRRGNMPPELESFSGATYNLENGQVTTTKVDKSNIFKDKDDRFDNERIAFPNVKEGSVIEYTFKVVYPGISFIPPWSFQGAYPELWSEYDVTIPLLADYFVKTQGYQKFVVDTTIASTASFHINIAPGGVPFSGMWSGQTVRRIWAEQNVPALAKKEVYTTALSNHISKVSFQLSAIQVNGYKKTFRNTWQELSEELLKNEHFGDDLRDRNRWIDDELKKVIPDLKPTEAVARQIYDYVRDHITSLPVESIYAEKPIKKVWEDKQGGAAATNLLLTAIYKHEGFDADPVILSTRGHGYPIDTYPILSDYDYVITRLRIGEKEYLLDASKDYLGFGQLPDICYNGPARVIGKDPVAINLVADSLTENRQTVVQLYNTDSGYAGIYTRRPGEFESMEIRSRLKKEKPEDFFGSLRKGMADYKTMTSFGIDSLDKPGLPLAWHYEMKYRFTGKRYYFNPILHERLNTNPFNAAERHYPVEIPYRINNVYILHMEVPKGYTVDELPKSQRISLGNEGGFFEYQAQLEGDIIDLRIQLHLNKAYYTIDEYQALREFYKLIVSKEQEPFVFKKGGTEEKLPQ